jgi:hypothetical protein
LVRWWSGCGASVGMASSRWRPNSRTKFCETDRTTAPTNFCWATSLTELGVPRRTRTGHNVGPRNEILRKPGEPPSISSTSWSAHKPIPGQADAPWAPRSAAPREGDGGGDGEVGVSCEQRCRGCRRERTQRDVSPSFRQRRRDNKAPTQQMREGRIASSVRRQRRRSPSSSSASRFTPPDDKTRAAV